ncbi:MAG: hypothetical protein F4X09_00750 [Gammaproteobacteria bacterium]|nr:hypothetical protein [Gammaproteobacteria bacterium]
MMALKNLRHVPRLRFPEFQNSPEWNEVSLGALLVQTPDYGVNAAAVPFSKTLPTYIRITDINSDGQFAPCPRVSVNVDADEDRYLKDGDIVLARTGASVGKSYRYREEDGRLIYAGFLIRVRPDPQQILSKFLAVYLLTRKYWDWVRLTSARSGQPGINSAEYASMSVSLPPDGRDLAEQQKIADCVGSLDDLIAAEDRKLEALRQHKKGLMQQIFPHLGETVPRLRFPEFQDSAVWEPMKFGDIASRGKETFDPRKSSDTPRLIELENIESKTGRILGVAELEKQNSLKSRFETGDVLFGKLRPYLQKFAQPDFSGVCTTEIWVLRSKVVLTRILRE